MPKRRRQRHWYEDLGLEADPFAAPPATLFGDEARKLVLARMLLATSRTSPVLVVTGAGGVGKSTLLRAARARAADDALCLSLNGNLFTDPGALTQQLWHSLTEAAGPIASVGGSAREFGQALAALSKERSAIHLLVDDAGEYDDSCLDLLIGLGGSLSSRPFRVVLVGDKALADRLSSHPKAARMAFETLSALSEAGTAAYLSTRLRDVKLANGETLVLTDDERARIIREARGNPASIEAQARSTLRARVRRRSSRARSDQSKKRRRSKRTRALTRTQLAGAVGLIGALLIGAGLLMQPPEPTSAPIASDEEEPADAAPSPPDEGGAQGSSTQPKLRARAANEVPAPEAGMDDAERSATTTDSRTILQTLASFFGTSDEESPTARDEEVRASEAASGTTAARGAARVTERSGVRQSQPLQPRDGVETRRPLPVDSREALSPSPPEPGRINEISIGSSTPAPALTFDQIAGTPEQPRTSGALNDRADGASGAAPVPGSAGVKLTTPAAARTPPPNPAPAPVDARVSGLPETTAPTEQPGALAAPEGGASASSGKRPDAYALNVEAPAIQQTAILPAEVNTDPPDEIARMEANGRETAAMSAGAVEPTATVQTSTPASERIAMRTSPSQRDVLATRASLLDRLRGAESAAPGTAARVPSSQTAQAYGGRLAGEREILELPSDALVLQVMVVSSATRAALWFTEQRGTGSYAVYARGQGAERQWIVLQGPFEDRGRAEAAAREFERRTGVSNPWVRSVADVQAEIEPI